MRDPIPKRWFVIGWIDGTERGTWTTLACDSHVAINKFVAHWARGHTMHPESYWIEMCPFCLTSHKGGGCTWRERLTNRASSESTAVPAGLRSE